MHAEGYGIKLIQCPTTNYIILLWPTYFMPHNTHPTLSPTALKHYLKYPKVITDHLHSLQITTTCGRILTFPSIPQHTKNNVLDYHLFNVVKPLTQSTIHPILQANKSYISPLTRPLVHQRLAHCNQRKLDDMCRRSTLLGLPRKPFPPCTHQCPICLMSKFSHPPKGQTTSTNHLTPGQLLHLDFGFWDLTSHRGFSSMLLIIDAKTRMLWLFCTSNKRAPIKILSYFFSIMKRENKIIKTIRVDEDGALARSFEFTELLLQHSITLETTGGYASFLNGKVERPNRTIADMVRALYFNAGHSANKWCYAAETAADIYRLTLHSALGISPYEAWYGIKPRIDDLRVWGCTVYVREDSPKKSHSKVHRGYFMGFTKSRLLIRWLDPTTDTVKHACAVRFNEHDVPISSDNKPSPGSLLLRNDSPIPSFQPPTEIDLSDYPHLQSEIFSLTINLPPTGQYLGCQLSTCTYHNLPYFTSFTRGTHLAQLFSSHGTHNTTFWILSLHDKEFSHAPSVVTYIQSL